MSGHLPHTPNKDGRRGERGNMLFIILLAVVLIGVLTAAITSTNNPQGANIDKEQLAIYASEVQRYGSELERAVLFIMNNGVSENDIRFAHPDAPSDYGDLSADSDPSDQVFHRRGGGALYRDVPDGINDGSMWEFYGSSDIPGVGSGEADLVVVLPNVTNQFCDKINDLNNQTGTPTDLPIVDGPQERPCIHAGALGRFDDGQQFYTGTNINDIPDTTFEQDPNINAARPASQACVVCSLDDSRHFYHVLMAR